MINVLQTAALIAWNWLLDNWAGRRCIALDGRPSWALMHSWFVAGYLMGALPNHYPIKLSYKIKCNVTNNWGFLLTKVRFDLFCQKDKLLRFSLVFLIYILMWFHCFCMFIYRTGVNFIYLLSENAPVLSFNSFKAGVKMQKLCEK